MALISLIILLLFNTLSDFQIISRTEVVVFNLPGRTLVALTIGSETYWITSPNSGTMERLNYYIKPYEGYREIKKSTVVYLSEPLKVETDNLLCINNFMNFKGIRIYLHDAGSMKESEWKKFPTVDLFLISEKSKTDPETVKRHLPSSEIVDCRILNNRSEGTGDQEKYSNKFPFLKTSVGVAVQITIGQNNNGQNKIRWSGYFGH